MTKTILLLSGGMDSTTLLHDLCAAGDEVVCLCVRYGQRHQIEREYAKTNAERVSCELVDIVADCFPLFEGSCSALVEDVSVPRGHYADASMKQTIVPNRNMIMLAMAGAVCLSRGLDRVAYAGQSGEGSIYADCRPEFVAAMRNALHLCSDEPIELHAPYIDWTKAQICSHGFSLDVPFRSTYSCYEGKSVHCGKCGTCVKRKEAFEVAGVNDPTVYYW